MLLGCCHCDEPVSSSSGNSSSSGASSSYNTTGCIVCGVAPQRYLATVNLPVHASPPSCCVDYNRAFVLNHVSGCNWQSDELGLYAYYNLLPSPRCGPITGTLERRISLLITGALTYTITMTHYTANSLVIPTTLRISNIFVGIFSSSDCFANRTIPWNTESSASATVTGAVLGSDMSSPCRTALTSGNASVNLVAL